MFKRQPSEPHLGFSIRTNKPNLSASIVCRLSFNGERTCFYMSGLVVNSSDWISAKQGLPDTHPYVSELADELEEVRQQHKLIWQDQKALTCPNGKPFRVSVHTIKDEWLTKSSPVSSGQLVDLYEEFLKHLKALTAPDSLSPRTIAQYRVVGEHLASYLAHTKQATLTVDDLSSGWGRKFYDWLKLKRDATTAARYVGKIRNALQHAADYDRISTNPLATLRLKGSRKKPIRRLTDLQLTQLEVSPLRPKMEVARKWALLQSYTALDFNDAKVVIDNLSQYVTHTADGDKLIYQRLKYKDSAEWGECHIPILPEAAALLTAAQYWPKLEIGVFNKHLKEISTSLGLPFKLHSKLLRKTGAEVFLRKGFDINAVQKIMGHQNRSTTENFYCNLPGVVVDQQMCEINQQHIPLSSFVSPFPQARKATNFFLHKSA